MDAKINTSMFLYVGKPVLRNLRVVTFLSNSFFKDEIKFVVWMISDSKWIKFKLIEKFYSSLHLCVINHTVWFRILWRSHVKASVALLAPRRALYTWWYLIPCDNAYDMWSENKLGDLGHICCLIPRDTSETGLKIPTWDFRKKWELEWFCWALRRPGAVLNYHT